MSDATGLTTNGDIPMYIIYYNIDLIARSQVESSRLTRQSFERPLRHNGTPTLIDTIMVR